MSPINPGDRYERPKTEKVRRAADTAFPFALPWVMLALVAVSALGFPFSQLAIGAAVGVGYAMGVVRYR